MIIVDVNKVSWKHVILYGNITSIWIESNDTNLLIPVVEKLSSLRNFGDTCICRRYISGYMYI